jgi:murein L,D-transpeptidase YafK
LIALSHSRGRLRLLLASAAVAAAVSLAGCNTDGIDMAKALKPLSAEMMTLLEAKAMDKTAPIVVRVFKEESELEVWKQDRDGQYALLKTYPICRWSGELGPKVKTGDRQAPEGFYTITPAQMNPRSQYYLSFNLGYPNAFDRAHGRTGSHLMVHGDCSSAGCYSMTDDQIQEIYALGREAFFGGQKSFQVQAYPFRMTAQNMARHRNNPHLSFWKTLKEGNDHFELARAEPKVDVCDRRYVFNAQEPNGSSTPLQFNPTGRCPTYEVPAELAAAVAEKNRQDQHAFAEYVRRGIATAPITMGQDGGMHPSFVAALNPQHVRDTKGNVRWMVEAPALGTKVSAPSPSTDPRFAPPVEPTVVASLPQPANVPMPRPAPRRAGSYVTAASPSAAPSPAFAFAGGGQTQGSSGGGGPSLFSDTAIGRAASSVGRVFGLGSEEQKPAPKVAAPARPQPVRTTRKPKSEPSSAAAAKPAQPQRQTADAASASAAAPEKKPAGSANLLPGSQPVLQSGGFENRWPSSFR